jgi:hypothetical protein
MARARRQAPQDSDYTKLYDLHQPLPALSFQQLDLFGRGRDAVTESLPQLIEWLQSMQAGTLTSAETLNQLRSEALALQADLAALEEEILADLPQRGERNTPAQFGRAERFCGLHSAIACLGIWLCNRSYLGPFFADGRWLIAALARRGNPRFHTGSLRTEHVDLLAAQLLHQFEAHQMFSLLPWPLAGKGAAEILCNSDTNHSEDINDRIPA